MDIESYHRWYAYSRARDVMLEETDSDHSPWFVVRSNDKRRARLNCIAHVLKSIPFKRTQRTKVKLSRRSQKGEYDDQATIAGRRFVTEEFV
jgi:polyphosphate kinase